ncbi:hydroxymethylglutaryl-CoA lyase [Myxococcota bacterium]|nr:hydroxymethylglutaryl-CoA lyase [Myxococcota bacterium]
MPYRLPSEVRVVEVGLRDGLQNEAAFVHTDDKLRLLDALLAAGLRDIEFTSFVHPRWVPALADADRLAARLQGYDPTLRLSALTPNMRGLERAIATGVREVAVFMSASETHNLRNINKGRDETWPVFEPIFARAAEAGLKVRAYLSTAWGCPYEGDVAPCEVLRMSQRLLEMGAYEISLGDTIGVGDPLQTRRLLEALLSALPADKLAMHMHDTRGAALANCMVGLEMGITTFDTSLAGLGGCPYAPGASGNLATEDLVYALERMGVRTGVDLDALLEAGCLAQRLLGRPLAGRVLATKDCKE